MKDQNPSEICITGIGVTSAIGQGKSDFISALLEGRQCFDVMKRPGRQRPDCGAATEVNPFIGAEIPLLDIHSELKERNLRTASYSGQVALVTLLEAWKDARLDEMDPFRIGLVVGGSNFQNRELVQVQDSYKSRVKYLRPSYGMSFMDTDLCGICTEVFSIRGFAYTLGGASASGQLAILQATQAVAAGQVDVCIAIGTLMDLSYWECQGFRSIGGMGSDRFAQTPWTASRPFDLERDGFIFGESCGVVIVEMEKTAVSRGIKAYAGISGSSIVMDGNRNPNPSLHGETDVIRKVLRQAGLPPAAIDYVNPHGSGSVLGDATELEALCNCELNHAYINATKSITGHGLSAAGAVEVIATVLQMQNGKIHPTLNLDCPISKNFNWVYEKAVNHRIKHAITLSMGFGGINTALCLTNPYL